MLTLFKYFLIGTLIGLVVAICGLLLLEVDNISSAEKRSKGTLEQSQLQLNGSASNSPPVALRNRVFVPSNVHELAFPKHAFERKATIFAWVSSLSNNQILDLLERSKDPLWNTSESNRFALQFTLLQKLSITAPDKAITFALSRVEPQRYTMASMVIQEWASTDLEAAVAHLRGMNIRDAEFFLPIVLPSCAGLSLNRQRNIAKQLGDESYAILHYFRDIIDGNVESPREAWYEVVNLQSQESVQSTINYVLGHILVAWVEREGLEVVDEVVSSIAKDLTYGTSLSRVFSELSADQLAEIFDSLIRNLNEELFEVIQRIELVNSWARQDPKGVLARAETLPATELRQTLEWSAVRQWANINPRELLDELELVPLVHRKFAMSSAIRVLTRKSPRDATQFVENEVDFESQLFLATSLVREWCKHDAEATKDWVYKFAENNPLRNALMRPLAIALVVTHPRDAFQIALEQPIEELDSTLGRSSVFEASILSLIASVDLELAIELLPKVRDMGNNKMSAYSTVGVSLIEKGETEQAFDLAKQLSDEVQTQYFQSIASSWSLRDAQGLLQSFDDFPTDFIKSKMADSLRVLNKYTKVYSTEEIQGLEKYLSGKDSEK